MDRGGRPPDPAVPALVVLGRPGPGPAARDAGRRGRRGWAGRAGGYERRRVPNRRRAGGDPDGEGRGGSMRSAPHRQHPDWSIEDEHPEPRESRIMLFALIIVSVGLAATAQIVLKHGMNQVVHRTGHAFQFNSASRPATIRTPAVW